MLLVINRGAVRRITVQPWKTNRSVHVRITRHNGAGVSWWVRDKRLEDFATYPFVGTVDQLLAFLKSVVSTGQKAWLTRWLNSPEGA